MASTLPLNNDAKGKIDDKQCDIFSLIWLDDNVDDHAAQNTEQKLRSIINYLKKFQDVKLCQKYIEQTSKNDRIVLIVSGRLGQEIVGSVHQLRSLVAVYVYCMNKKAHEKWALKHTKVRAVVDDLDVLVNKIAKDHNIQKKVDEPLPIDIFTASAGAGETTMGVNGQFVFSQVLFDCLFRLKYNQADKDELISCCKNEYANNRLELENLEKFEKDYKPDRVLHWYTRETFFYKSLNAALRKQNFHMIFLFRGYISDIQQQLQKYQSSKLVKVYRAQKMTLEELGRLKESMGKLISINSFFSTSISYTEAISFLDFSSDLERVLFEIKADPKMSTTKPFAGISKQSDYPDEAEVLFMIGSIFRLESIAQNETKVWIVRMTLSSNEEHGLQQVLMYMKGQLESGDITLRTLGKFLWRMGQFGLAETYLLRLLKEIESDDPLNSTLYDDLGELAALRGNFDASVHYQQKALRLKNAKQVNETNSLEALANTLTQQTTVKPGGTTQGSTKSRASTLAAEGIDAQQFKQWLENYIRQHAAALAEQSSSASRHSQSVENFCFILENQPSITDDEQQALRGLINLGFTFDAINSEECIKLFRSIRNERIVLILSKTSMVNLPKPIREEPFLSAIYVIDSSRDNSFDSNFYRGSFPNVVRLCKQLENDLPLIAYDLTNISSIPADYVKMSTINYVQALKDIVLDADETHDWKKEMIEFCAEKYAGNTIQLKLIDEFETSFQPGNAIQWYSRQDAFVYKMLARAFRIFDVDIIYKLRFFIQHLHRQLESSSDTSPLTVYRTLRVRKDLFEKVKSYQNGLLSFNEFLLASKDQPIAEPSPMNMDSKLVHFQINLGAGTSRQNIKLRPNEILLTVGTVFRIDNVEPIDDNTFAVKITTNCDVLKAGQLISKDLRGAVRSPFPVVRILKLLKQRESKDHAAYFAAILMNDPQAAKNEEANVVLGGILHSLGGQCYERKQYDQGLTHLQNALQVYLRVLPPDDNRLTPTYNNIGSIYHRQELHDKALAYHLKAYEIQKNSADPDMESVAAYVGNIAGVLAKLNRHKEAIRYYEMDLRIQQKRQSKQESPEIAVKHHNLAGMQYRAHLYSEALLNYQKCLEIELNCYSADHPTVAVTYTNLATALEKLGRHQEAKVAVEKAIERLLRSKQEDDEEVQRNRKYLKQLDLKFWMKDLFASTEVESN